MIGETAELERLREFLANIAMLELAILVGSRATGRVHAGSDW